MNRNERIPVRCTADEKRWYEDAAEKAGMSLSAWIRMTLNHEVNNRILPPGENPGTPVQVEPTEEEIEDSFGPSPAGFKSLGPKRVKHTGFSGAHNEGQPAHPSLDPSVFGKRSYEPDFKKEKS